MDIFREKITTEAVESDNTTIPTETKDVVTDKDVPQTKEAQDFGKLEIWECENKKKYVHEYFGVHNTSHEFTVKMPTAEIDKFIREQLDERGYEKTTKNYKEILAEIEQEIGSDKLELFKRFNKLTGYIRILRKLYATKKMKEKYLNTDISA